MPNPILRSATRLLTFFVAALASLSCPVATVADELSADWRFYGRDAGGSRYAPFDQINRGNVDKLEVAWTFRTGDIASNGSEDQNTPLMVGDTLYACTPRNIVIAINAENGAERWRFDPKSDNWLRWRRCRGLGYHKAGAAQSSAICAERILVGTIDARLIALDAKSGRPCPDFGNDGTVNLLAGLGKVKPGFYFVTSPPTVARDKVIVGGWVLDNAEVGEPSGVIRAFDATTGAFAWAWDMGRPGEHGMPPPHQTFTPGTPNSWSMHSYDDKLGLVYIPTGNATPDYWGGKRSEAAEKYSSSVVALDIETGAPRWSFQTTHHDLWDYDVPAQPVLVDLPVEDGPPTPALIQATKRGEVFLLDRRDGKPLAEVEERPAPQGAAEGDWVAATQPYSVGMPSFAGAKLTEADMWGLTPLDQMLCRIMFKRLLYDGAMTPPSVQGSLQYPGNGGGMNWGSVAVDTGRMIMIVNDLQLANVVRLIPRAEIAESGPNSKHRGVSPQIGTPFGVDSDAMMSVLGLPCQRPPYGSISAVDLTTRTLLWTKPVGTAEALIGLPLPQGMPTLGGSLVTKGGLTFFAGTQDFYLRAFDSKTGAELLKAPLPVGAQATPMSYISPTGRQMVVVSAGGARGMPGRGDYIIAYALPSNAQSVDLAAPR